MGDSTDGFRALTKARREEKAARLAVQNARLADGIDGICFRRLTPYHVRMWANGRRADYWPSTGRWFPVDARLPDPRTLAGDLDDVVRYLTTGAIP